MVITEEELREAWRNGQGQLPDFPPDARFTPAARDFLTARGLCPQDGQTGTGATGGQLPRPGTPVPPAAFAAWLQGAASSAFAPDGEAEGRGGGRMELKGEGGKRLILTARDVDDLVRARPETIVVHPSATITDAARDRLRNAGIRLVPFTEKRPEPPEPISHNATAQPPAGGGRGPGARTARRSRKDPRDGNRDRDAPRTGQGRALPEGQARHHGPPCRPGRRGGGRRGPPPRPRLALAPDIRGKDRDLAMELPELAALLAQTPFGRLAGTASRVSLKGFEYPDLFRIGREDGDAFAVKVRGADLANIADSLACLADPQGSRWPHPGLCGNLCR